MAAGEGGHLVLLPRTDLEGSGLPLNAKSTGHGKAVRDAAPGGKWLLRL